MEYTSRTESINAVQWLGDNLEEVKELLSVVEDTPTIEITEEGKLIMRTKNKYLSAVPKYDYVYKLSWSDWGSMSWLSFDRHYKK